MLITTAASPHVADDFSLKMDIADDLVEPYRSEPEEWSSDIKRRSKLDAAASSFHWVTP
jgi:hypothetical protein